jgi:hypothetical protein
MSQHDMNIANQGFPAFRSDLNDALAALASTSTGATEPTTTFAQQLWYDSTANLLKMRNTDNDAWITLAYFDQTNDEWEIRSAVIQAVDSAGVVIKTDDGTTRLTIADSGAITTQGNLTVGANLDVSSGTIKLDGNYPVGTGNTALGDGALDDGSLSGNNNVAIGGSALTANTSGAGNVAVGSSAAGVNTTGSSNSVLGNAALLFNQSGSNNVAIGETALYQNTTASSNTAVGYQALYDNTTGIQNTALGFQAGADSTTVNETTYLGAYAGSQATGEKNTFIGGSSGYNMTTGSKNTIIGRYNGNQGGLDIRTSSNNIVLSDGDGVPRSRYESSLNRWTLEANASDNIAFALRNNATSQPYGIYLRFGGSAPDDTTRYFMECNDTSTARFRIYSDGDVVNHDNSYGAISDVKLKEQITDASSQWGDIKSLNIRKYKMKSDVAEKGDSDEHWRLGVIAQEVEEAGMSGLIKTSPDMIENEDGQLVESGEYTKQVKYSILYMKAVKALQEAMDRIETLEAKVATLESN